MKELTQDAFSQGVISRDGGRCVICEADAACAHHIIERALWGESGGYFLDNGANLCKPCHLLAEQTFLSCEIIREAAGIKTVLLPDHFEPATRYDKWGNPFRNGEVRLRGELFEEENVQKILKSADLLGNFLPWTKYPRTMHLPWSPGLQNDDRVITTLQHLEGQEVVATLKLDGENTTWTHDHIHARSLDSKNHPSRNWVKALHGRLCHEIPLQWRICGENLYACHSLFYRNLPSYFVVFNIWDKATCLSWDETVAFAQILGLHTVPVLWRGIWQEDTIRGLSDQINPETCEGLVIRLTDAIPAGLWSRSSAKWVRKGHVQTDEFWMNKPILPNQLAPTAEKVSFLAEPTP